MVRNIKQLLKDLGWADGFNIPVANEENKKLEAEVSDLLSLQKFILFVFIYCVFSCYILHETKTKFLCYS